MFEKLKELFREKVECVGKDVCKVEHDEALLAYCKELEKKLIKKNLNPEFEFIPDRKPVRVERDMGIENRLRITIAEMQKANAKLSGGLNRLSVLEKENAVMHEVIEELETKINRPFNVSFKNLNKRELRERVLYLEQKYINKSGDFS